MDTSGVFSQTQLGKNLEVKKEMKKRKNKKH